MPRVYSRICTLKGLAHVAGSGRDGKWRFQDDERCSWPGKVYHVQILELLSCCCCVRFPKLRTSFVTVNTAAMVTLTVRTISAHTRTKSNDSNLLDH